MAKHMVTKRMVLATPAPGYAVVGYPESYAEACKMACKHYDTTTTGIYSYKEEGSPYATIIEVSKSRDTTTVESREIKPKFSPGEQVRYINSNGVDWGIRNIVSVEAISYSESGVGYKIEPTDSPWYAVSENQLSRPSVTGTEPLV